MDLYLKGKTAVVTGASQGMGRAIAKELAMEGVRVLATARSEKLLDTLREEIIEAGGVEPATFVQDFVAADGPTQIADAAFSKLREIDILINNAGRTRPLDVIAPDQSWSESMT